MEEAIMGISQDEGWLERSQLIDSLLAKMEFHADNISALCAKIVCGGEVSISTEII